jgi:adenylate cyclase class 2
MCDFFSRRRIGSLGDQKHIETEVKIKLGDLQEIEQRLNVAGARMKAGRVYERNVRYDDANNSLTPTGRLLRLRQDTRARLTYKEPGETTSTRALARPELEVEVSDFETMDLMLHKLGYRVAWIYEKYRTTYELNACEITLDELPFGMFMEVEGESESIERVLATLNLAAASRIPASYSDLFFRLKAEHGLAFRDLTFENFKEIEHLGIF